MKLFIIALLVVGISVYSILGNTIGEPVPEQDETQIDSRFGWSDVESTVKKAGNLVQSAHKVGDWVLDKAGVVKDAVVHGYDYLKKTIKPNDGYNQGMDIRTVDQNQNQNQNQNPGNTYSGPVWTS
jgi:hypothetical protein